MFSAYLNQQDLLNPLIIFSLSFWVCSCDLPVLFQFEGEKNQMKIPMNEIPSGNQNLE